MSEETTPQPQKPRQRPPLTKEQVRQELWARFTSALSSGVRSTVKSHSQLSVPASTLAAAATPATPPTPQSEEHFEFRKFRESLSGPLGEQLDAMTAAATPEDQDPPVEFVHDVSPKYGVVVAPDGEWPVLKIFRKAEDMVKRIHENEGKDVVVWAFYGIPLPITRAPERLLILPNDTALRIKDGKPVRRIEGVIAVQDNGFIGHPLTDPTHHDPVANLPVVVDEEVTAEDDDEVVDDFNDDDGDGQLA